MKRKGKKDKSPGAHAPSYAQRFLPLPLLAVVLPQSRRGYGRPDDPMACGSTVQYLARRGAAYVITRGSF